MFNLPDRMIEPDEVKTGREPGTIEDCEKIDEMFRQTVELIKAGNDDNFHDKWIKATLEAHNRMIEDRTDWDMCQKTVRRRRIISMWHNTQIVKKNTEDKTE